MSQPNFAIEELGLELTPTEKAAYLLMHAKATEDQSQADNVIDINFGGVTGIMEKTWITAVRVETMITIYGEPTMTIRHGDYKLHQWKELFGTKTVWMADFDDYRAVMVD